MAQRALMPDRPRGSMNEISAWRLVAYLAATLPPELVTCMAVTQYGYQNLLKASGLPISHSSI